MHPVSPSSTPQEREKRLKELSTYIREFQAEARGAEHKDLPLRDDCIEVIKTLYYRYADELLKPAIDSHRIQHFKIASTTELIILIARPIKLEDPEREKYFNARLALYIALRFVIEWNNELPAAKCYQVIASDDNLKSVLEEHFKWLYLLNPNYYNPIFFESHTWRLFFLLLSEKTKALK